MDALTLLRLQIEWGADEALADAPVDRLRGPGRNAGAERDESEGEGARKGSPLLLREGAGGRGSPPEPRRPNPSPQPPPSRGGGVSISISPARAAPPATASSAPPRATAPTATSAERAATAAGQAQTLEDLRAALAAFDGCALRDTAANLVFAAGAPSTGLLLIGEPPGEAEDRSGAPFAGPDGQLLDRMLASIGLTRESLMLSPLIPWRPPGGRPPSAVEIALCLPFLHRLIALAAPARLLLAGQLAARTLLGPTRRRAAPAWTDLAVPGHTRPIPALVMPSPAMVAHTPGARRDAWAALRLLRRTLDADFAKM